MGWDVHYIGLVFLLLSILFRSFKAVVSIVAVLLSITVCTYAQQATGHLMMPLTFVVACVITAMVVKTWGYDFVVALLSVNILIYGSYPYVHSLTGGNINHWIWPANAMILAMFVLSWTGAINERLGIIRKLPFIRWKHSRCRPSPEMEVPT